MVTLRTGEAQLDVPMGVYNPESGRYRWLSIDSYPMERDGETWVQAVFTDVTDLRDALSEAMALRGAMNEHVIVSVTDLDGTILDVNDRFCRVAEYSRDELVGQNHSIVNSGHHPPEFFEKLWRTISSGEVWRGEIRNRSKSGRDYWVLTTIVPILDASARIQRYMSVRTDITEQKEAEASSAEAALLDALTGLPNRRRFDVEMRARWLAAAVGGDPLAVLMLDLDHFKEYNDAYGHPQGDRALREVARTLAASLSRRSDLVARWGGEEFVVLLPATGLTDAVAVGERMVRAVADLDLDSPVGEATPRITASVGVAVTSNEHVHDPDALVAAADRELYRAKRAGRNRVMHPHA